MIDVLEPAVATAYGYRLHRLEIYNWGTFDSAGDDCRGQVYRVQPNGQTTLLIGHNGSGKSTLVDALVTLLVRPNIRNYNVAAGAKKRERDERTYVKGAYDRRSRVEDNRADVQFLRPDGSNYSVLLACFHNEETGGAITLAQVLYLTADGRVEKVYCFSTDERTIAGDVSGFRSMDKLQPELKKRGFRTTKTYSEYHQWFRKATGLQPKAMDMFNQTVAVKDIQRLNDFIREHMLEAKPWGEKVQSLLTHFTQLSEAHRSLVRVRRQAELLEPIAEQGDTYREQARRLEQTERIIEAADSFFRQQVLDLFTPELELCRAELKRLRENERQLSEQIEQVQDECRRLINEINEAGGDRLREIPRLIENEKVKAAAKRTESERYHEALEHAGISGRVTDAETFAAVREHLPQMLEETDTAIAGADGRRTELQIERAEAARTLREDEAELVALQQRKDNVPEWLAEVRRRLCDDLRLPVKDLPFAAELVAVKPSEQPWEASLELVLHNFALSLLVPDRHYRAVSQYVDRTRLSDGRGRGQKLVYLRIGKRRERTEGPPAHPTSLVRKLDFRDGHALLPWVRAELEQHFDYRCCDTIEEFQQQEGLALTRQRHVKSGRIRHTKDDRERVSDPRHFVLGWDNTEKRRRLAEAIAELRDQIGRFDAQITRLDDELQQLRTRQTAIRQAQQVEQFAALDHHTHEAEIAELELEKRQLEEENDTIQTLKRSLAERQARLQTLKGSRDELLKEEGQLTNVIGDAEKLIRNAKQTLSRRTDDGTLPRHQACFDMLSVRFADDPLTAGNLLEREPEFRDAVFRELEQLRRQIEPVKTELLKAMNRFLREFPDERSDLDTDVAYLDSFQGLLEEIRDEGLPRHEQRFKERLNDKVTREIGLLHGELQRERGNIEDKIEVLNVALGQLEYRPGTHMRLEARLARDREITEFRDALAECLSGTFEGTLEADEARFLQIEKLITRLREEERWRSKVTDVRRWFDFAAREIDDATGEERSYYEDSTGQSGGEKAKLAFTILVAAIAYQYDIDPSQPGGDRFHFVVVDEMFSKVDDQYAQYALELFQKFGLQLFIVAPLDAKARVTEPYVGCYLLVTKDDESRSVVHSMTAREFEEQLAAESGDHAHPREPPRRPR